MIDSHSSSLQVIFNDWFDYLSGKRVGSDTVYSCNVNPDAIAVKVKNGSSHRFLGKWQNMLQDEREIIFPLGYRAAHLHIPIE